MADKRIYLSPPHMGGNEIKYVQTAFDENWIAPLGPNVDGFEKDIVSYSQCGHAAALTSGTGALHLALILSGVGYGDEVLCSTFTFSASANPITYVGARPIFVESEKDTWNMSPEFLREAILNRIAKGKKPKAIVMVHLYGQPGKIKEIISIGDEYGIPVIEDAAESLGATVDGKMTGTFGKFGIYSFNGNKIITTSGGGALVSQDKSLIDKARFLSTQARDPAPHYEHTHIGFNYRMSNIVAGIGRGQMEVIAERVKQRRKNFDWYKKLLTNVHGVTFLEEYSGTFSNRWLTCILIDPSKTFGITREELRIAFENQNIESRPLWKPMHMQPVFRNELYFGDRLSEKLFEIGLCLPSGSSLTESDFEKIASVMKITLKF